MFDREHHRRIASVLDALDPEVMRATDCWFAGGTWIALQIHEFRRSDDIDLICGSAAGYRRLRSLTDTSISPLFRRPVEAVKDLRKDPYRMHTFLSVEGVPIKFEIFHENRIEVSGHLDETLGIPVLSRDDLFTEKLLANDDRGRDSRTLSRDVIDLGMMIREWGPIPAEALRKAQDAYGDVVAKSFRLATTMIGDPVWFGKCLKGLDINPDLADPILAALEQAAIEIGGDPRERIEAGLRRKRLEELRSSENREPITAGLSALLAAVEDCREEDAAASWARIERQAVEIGLGKLAVDPQALLAAIRDFSPGCVFPERILAIEQLIERREEPLRILCESHADDPCEPRS
ncbi:nucleotidyl transferase AbiEii/AbiGii toxin family protein [Cereibacter sphaeroides]|uniref:nucleotidyl transferase AbiEii/AbiGii toxin family protein n=1 Tax=Cereibacter sphaeroides TaxID=1063 RepID=UPI001F377C96|nr:nucleotidyl transferase AbiEii/AbiGii toxin family protein [Cereibacter sphaeroides]MCE6958066.1 nucleotidyl transferase AbiEii/AbiGii toxin family protein [Cereibacter sphaeroides]MCE6971323.1 nucleotidyl transferase AbiEii/AbiGii toxin family protein [Cereibacter sphaeroides]